MSATFARYYRHLRRCGACRTALAEHDEETAACGDACCSRIALCERGRELRDEALFAE